MGHVWENMGTYGKIWENMGKYGKIEDQVDLGLPSGHSKPCDQIPPFSPAWLAQVVHYAAMQSCPNALYMSLGDTGAPLFFQWMVIMFSSFFCGKNG